MDAHKKYSPRTDVDWEKIKKESLKYCTGNYDDDRQLTEEDIFDDYKPLWNALNSVDFDINQFFSRKLYLDLPDKGLNEYIIIVCLMAAKPMSDYVVDWLNGYLDFDFINPNITARAEWRPTEEIEILEYLWYCRSYEDVWWMMGQGIGSIKDLFHWYMGNIPSTDWYIGQRPPCYYIRDVNKALDMILFLEQTFGKTNNAVTDSVRDCFR